MPRYYTAARTNQTDKGSFKNKGQKSGKQGAIKSKPAMEAEKDKHADLQIKKLTDEMYGQKKARKVPAKKGVVVGMGRN